MTQAGSSAIQSRRLVLAIAIVAAIVFCPVVIGSDLPERTTGESARVHSSFPFAQDASTPDAALDDIEARLGGVASTAPVQFAKEAGLPSGARDVRVSDDGMVVGFSIDGDSKTNLTSRSTSRYCDITIKSNVISCKFCTRVINNASKSKNATTITMNHISTITRYGVLQ